ncbi:hypothetical protein I7X30_04775 [Capnocytophaga sp. 051621]|uniref:Tetratricopeptide repeat protein n=1 Tax=Capnocytophaga periodontitidis TaxID=2795027 RepID=A0ABS0SKU2_9FLAO|nr:hypothetical protein [Capnocytophaga periodontitidis]MBI1646371.1 hypothetical protein [Capnocytophaga periodontitidis]
MTVKEFIEIIRHPYTINDDQVYELDEIVKEYPYFQAARVLQLKILHSEGNYKYNKALKLAAVHVTDRSVLFDFINSKTIIPDFSALRRDFERIRKARERKEAEEAENTPPKVSYIDHEPRSYRPYLPNKSIFEEPIFPEDLVNHQELADVFIAKEPEEKTKTDADNISQWLENISEEHNEVAYKNDKVAEKFKLIDKFLESNPKIEASRDYVSNVNLADEVKSDPKQLMTETLAQVYVNQRKFKQAIQAYEILILKNPKKSAYFAAQIENIKKLQQNNL